MLEAGAQKHLAVMRLPDLDLSSAAGWDSGDAKRGHDLRERARAWRHGVSLVGGVSSSV